MAKILVVDDNETDRILIGEILTSAGHEPVYARDGREALRAMDKLTGIDVMITDLRMPFVNGLRLIRSRRNAGDSIPIIAISGVDAIQLSVAKDTGANAALTKPLNRDELLREVESALSANDSDWGGAWISCHPEQRYHAPNED